MYLAVTAVVTIMAVIVAVGAVTNLLCADCIVTITSCGWPCANGLCIDYIVQVALCGWPQAGGLVRMALCGWPCADGLVQMASCGLHCVVALWDCTCIVYPGPRSSR